MRVLTISVLACRKDLSTFFDQPENYETKWAVDYFNNVLQPREGNEVNYKILNKVSSLEGTGNKPNMKTPMWVRARSAKTSVYQFVEIPLKYSQKITKAINNGETVNELQLRASFDR